MNAEESNEVPDSQTQEEPATPPVVEPYQEFEPPVPPSVIPQQSISQPKPRGRRPKRGKRGRPSWKGTKLTVERGSIVEDFPPPESFLEPEPDKTLNIQEERPSSSLSLRDQEWGLVTDMDQDEMASKGDRNKVLDAMSQQFNSAETNETPKFDATPKRGKRTKKAAGSLKRKEMSTLSITEHLDSEELVESQSKKFRKSEELISEDDPALEIDLNEIEDPTTQLKIKSRKGRGRSLSLERSSPLFGRSRSSRVGSISPALSKDESSNDSSVSKGRTRLQQSAAKDEEDDPKSRSVLRVKGRSRRTSGSPLSIGSTSAKLDSSGRQLTIPENSVLAKSVGRPRREGADASQTTPTRKKKIKKHFKGLRYSFGSIKKKKKEDQKNKKLKLTDSSHESESVISEEIDVDSLDSLPMDTNSSVVAEPDPYDPTDEFDDSQPAVSEPLPLQHCRKVATDMTSEDADEDTSRWPDTDEPQEHDQGDDDNLAEMQPADQYDETEETYEETASFDIPESTEYIPPDTVLYGENGVQESTEYVVEESEQYIYGEEYQIDEQEVVDEETEEPHSGDQEMVDDEENEEPVVFEGEEYQFESQPEEEENLDEEQEVVQPDEDQEAEEVTYYQEDASPVEEEDEEPQENASLEDNDYYRENGEPYVINNEETTYDETIPETQEVDEYVSEEQLDNTTPDQIEEYVEEPLEAEDAEDPAVDQQEMSFEDNMEEASYPTSPTDQLHVSEEPLSIDEEQPIENGYHEATKEDSDAETSHVNGESLVATLPEEDSNDTSDASVQMKEDLSAFGALQGSTRRVSKRRTKDNERFCEMNDEKDSTRKSKRINHAIAPTNGLTLAPRTDGKGYQKVMEERDQEVANSKLSDILCKCRVLRNPKAVIVGGDIYCQAMDCLDGRMIGCCNTVSADTFVRVSNKIPFTLLCTIHRHRLRRHNCCPGCGLFCTQGVFFECRWDKCGARHYYHKLCGLFVNGTTLCPHCGTDEPPVEVNLELKLSRKPVVYLKQHQEKKGFVSSARMACLTSDTGAVEPLEETEVLAEGEARIVLPSGKNIHTGKVPLGINRDVLLSAINAIQAGKSFNVKLSAKAIYWASKYDDLEKLIYVLNNGLNPNVKVKEYGNQTGLHTASIHGSLAAMHVLILAGASLDLTDSQLLTPLMVAIIKGNNDIVHYLVQAGAALQAKTQDGMTCLHLAAKGGNFASCKHILDSGRLSRHTINIQDEGGWTPLVWASENRCINVVKMLLECGADPQICDVEQNTALHWAAYSGSTHICSMVLDRGCSLRSMNAIGDTPLHIAARQNHMEAVVQLLARGAALDIKNTRGQTPLECCIPDSQCFLHMTLSLKLTEVMVANGLRTEKILSSDIACGKEAVPISCVNGADEDGLPKNYVYIAENCEALNVNIDRTITSLKYCDCVDGCNSDSCGCSQLNFQCWYDPEGRLLQNFNYVDPPMIFECNRACGCNRLSCHNRVVQHGMSSHMQLFKTEGKGWGVRALKNIQKGSYVCEYVGEIITDLEADQREDDSYLFDLDNRDSETFCIDARQYANVARFINHLCEPNLTPVKVFIDHQDLIFPRIAFFANREIEADEELGFDYGEKFWVIKYKQFTCTCCSGNCKYSSDTIQQTLANYNKKLQQIQADEPKTLET